MPFKVIQGHLYWYQSIAHIRLLITAPLASASRNKTVIDYPMDAGEKSSDSPMILNCRYHVYRIIASDISLKLDALGYISVAESIRASCHLRMKRH